MRRESDFKLRVIWLWIEAVLDYLAATIHADPCIRVDRLRKCANNLGRNATPEQSQFKTLFNIIKLYPFIAVAP
jgi:hypothetical protein